MGRVITIHTTSTKLHEALDELDDRIEELIEAFRNVDAVDGPQVIVDRSKYIVVQQFKVM